MLVEALGMSMEAKIDHRGLESDDSVNRGCYGVVDAINCRGRESVKRP